MNLAEKIYELRKKNRLSQSAFANSIGVSQAAVNYWEKGEREPRIEQLKKMANVYNIPITNFIYDEIDMSHGELLRQARLKKGFTQEQLGNILGISQESIIQFESQKGNLYVDSIEKVEDILNLSDTEMAEITKSQNNQTASDYIVLRFDSSDYTKEQLEKIKSYAAFLKKEI